MLNAVGKGSLQGQLVERFERRIRGAVDDRDANGFEFAREAVGVSVVNCTPDSALDAFHKLPLERALADRV